MIFFVLFVLVGAVMYFIFVNPFSGRDTREGEILNVKILDFENNSVKNIEVDLWRASQITGEPNARILITDKNGIASFNLTKGNYYIGFNLETFPTDDYIYPGQSPVTVIEGITQKIIILKPNA